MDIATIKNNKIKVILSYAIPSIISMLLTTTITITDGLFTGNIIGEEALASINLGLPILYLFLGLGLCLGVGGSVIAGQLLGAKNEKKASEVFTQTIVSTLIICTITSIVIFTFFSPILKLLKAEGNLAVYFTKYYQIMLFAYPFMVLSTTLGIFIRQDGKPQFCMVVSILNALLNCILDYILMAKFNMGLAGCAYASLFVQIISCLLELLYFTKGSVSLKIKPYKYDKILGRQMLFNGSSEFIGEMASALSMFSFNYVLMRYVGKEGVAAFTILGFAIYCFSMIAIGFGQGMCPIISIIQGGKDYCLSISIRNITNKIVTCIGFIFAISFTIFKSNYASLFGISATTSKMVVEGFYFMSITFILMGYNVISSMYFTSCGDAKSSAIISSLRGIILLLLFTYIFPYFWGLKGIWAAAPMTEIVTAIVTAYLILKHSKDVFNGRE